MKDNVILYSSGLDSYLLMRYLNEYDNLKNYQFIYFDIRSKYSDKEKIYLRRQQKVFKNLNIKILKNIFNFSQIEQNDAFIPFRNLYFLMYASKYSSNIYMPNTLSDRVNDADNDKLKKFIKCLNNFTYKKLKFICPFKNKHKADILRYFVEKYIIKDIKKEILDLTFSCYKPRKKKIKIKYHDEILGTKDYFETYECLKCDACFRKFSLLHYIGFNIKMDKNYQIPEKYYHDSKVSDFYNENTKFKVTKKYIEYLERV